LAGNPPRSALQPNAAIFRSPEARDVEDIVAQRGKDWGGELLDFNGEEPTFIS
jgi:hypothetical protein